MSALHPDQMLEMREIAAEQTLTKTPLARKWASLHEQSAQLTEMAGLATERFTEELAQFPDRVSQTGEWTQDLAQRGLDDMDAMMQPGITALHTISARGQDVTAPALALWCEFHRARAAILQLTRHNEPEACDAA
ncbi:MAG: hypothetical protein ABJP48_04640 [Erythrobacter sp.]